MGSSGRWRREERNVGGRESGSRGVYVCVCVRVRVRVRVHVRVCEIGVCLGE